MLLALLISTYVSLTPTTTYGGFPSELACIVSHESAFEQFTPGGAPLISPTDDVGLGKLNIPTWEPLAKKFGLDIINNAAQNAEMTVYLYEKYGGKIWSTDKYCKGSESS